MRMKKLEGDSPSNITTLKQKCRLDDVSDDILSNIQEFEGCLPFQNEKLCLLFKNLHTFKYSYLSDSVVVAHVTNNPTLKNVRFGVTVDEEETYLKFAANQVHMLDTCWVLIMDKPSQQLPDYLDMTKFAKQGEIVFHRKPVNDFFSSSVDNERYELVAGHKIIKPRQDGHPHSDCGSDYHVWEYKDLTNSHTFKIGHLDF